MKEGEIWNVQFTGQGHEYQKKRPAIIIQSNDKLKVSTVITIMPLTSQIENRHVDDILVKKSNQNNLSHDSLIKVHHIQSFDNSRFENNVGLLEPEILFEIKEYLKKHFGI